ncbi:hypothetical protein BHK98_05910 [Hornefia porci]|uniref:Uncharacterized protein n=1 Tax=Hornefia porci TaxID=2652292 RepID=A0A1Q9JHE4_9FIRM|nr:hypothetical protein [Hornefia porci]OLR55638.1 hypothetical protein BHK98_05910 [Hornefia porci]
MKKLIITLVAVCILSSQSSLVFASDEVKGAKIQSLSKQEEQIILNELSLDKTDLTAEDQVALLTKGTAVLWNKSYKNEYSVKKSLSMAVSLLTTGSKPYTTVKITNIGSNPITVTAYKGSIGGSTAIHSMTVQAGKAKTMTITRSDAVRYGTVNGQGTRVYLAYTVSAYNTNGKKISFKAYAKRFE